MQPTKWAFIILWGTALVLLKERIVAGIKCPVWLWNSDHSWWNHCKNNTITICVLVRGFIAGCLAFQKSYRCWCCIIHLVRSCHSCVLSCRFFQASWQQSLVWAGQSTGCSLDGHDSGTCGLCLAGKFPTSGEAKWRIGTALQRFQCSNDNVMDWKWTCLVYIWMFPWYWNHFREPFQINTSTCPLKGWWSERSEVSTPREIVEEKEGGKTIGQKRRKGDGINGKGCEMHCILKKLKRRKKSGTH